MARNDSFRVRWASNPAQFEKPQTSLIERGWAGGANEDPPEAKWENWWHNRVDEALAELEAHGALRWFSDVPYRAGAVVWHAGKRWLALDESVGVEPGGPLADGVWAPDVPIGKPTADPATPVAGPLLSGAMLAAGALVEQGENANGSYWRWESGLQVCVSPILATEYGEFADRVQAQWTYPAGFHAIPRILPGRDGLIPVQELAYGVPASLLITTTAATIRLIDADGRFSPSQQFPSVFGLAIGAWK